MVDDSDRTYRWYFLGGFEISRFFDAITSAVNELLHLEDEIDRLLEEAKVTIKTSRLKRRRSPQQKRPKKSVYGH
jgi:hypothetical protein